MRVLACLLFALALAIAGLAVFLYLLGQGAACSYALRSSSCRFKFPWELGSEDIIFVVILPWSLVALLVYGGIAAWRKAR